MDEADLIPLQRDVLFQGATLIELALGARCVAVVMQADGGPMWISPLSEDARYVMAKLADADWDAMRLLAAERLP